MYTGKHTQLLANHSSGRLLLSLQSSTPVQTKRSDEGGQKQDRKLPITSKLCFLCKNLDNIISGPQRTVQNKKTKAVHDPFKFKEKNSLCMT